MLYAIRLPSIAFGVGAVWFMWLAGLRLVSRRATWFLVVRMATWPQFAFLAGNSNVDTMAVFAVAVIILAWVRGLQTRRDSRSTWTPAVLSMYRSYVSDLQPQGRHLMPALPALVLLVVLGLTALRQQLTRITSVRPALAGG